MSKIARSFALARASWAVIRADRSLVAFPVLSAVAGIAVAALVLAPVAATLGVDDMAPNSGHPASYAVYAGLAFLLTTVAIYFQVALCHCAARALDGEDTTVGQGIAAASGRLPQILGWAVVTCTVNLVLRALQERLPFLGAIVVSLIGAAWNLATFFVTPVLALEGMGPVAALKRSVGTMRARWGEAVVGGLGIGLAVFVVGFVPGAIVIAAGVALASASVVPGVIVAAVGVVYLVAAAMIGSALGSVYRTALYLYARDGVVAGFDEQTLATAFHPKGRHHHPATA